MIIESTMRRGHKDYILGLPKGEIMLVFVSCGTACGSNTVKGYKYFVVWKSCIHNDAPKGRYN